jgi:hypothetical protein
MLVVFHGEKTSPTQTDEDHDHLVADPAISYLADGHSFALWTTVPFLLGGSNFERFVRI